MPKNSYPNYKCYPDESTDTSDLNSVFPSTNKEAILTALDNLHNKIQRLDRERLEALSRLQDIYLKNEPYEKQNQSQTRSQSRNNLSRHHNYKFSGTDINRAGVTNQIKCLNNKGNKFDEISFNDDDFLNSTMIKNGKRTKNRSESKCSEDKVNKTSILYDEIDPKSKYILNSGDRNSRQSSIIRKNLNEGTSRRRDDGSSVKSHRNNRFNVLDNIYKQSMDNDAYVTLPEISQDLAERLEIAEHRCSVLMDRFREINQSFLSKTNIQNRDTNPYHMKSSLTDSLSSLSKADYLDRLASLRAENERLLFDQSMTKKKKVPTATLR